MLAKIDLSSTASGGNAATSSSGGSLPLEIKPLLADVLLPKRGPTVISPFSASEFDQAVQLLQGFSRVESTFQWDHDSNGGGDSGLQSLSRHLRKWAALTVIYAGDDEQVDKNVIRLAGSLPAANDPVFVRVHKMPTAPKWKVVVCCDHALPVNSIMNAMKKATEAWIELTRN
jgi:hypothetical protein